MGMRHRGERLVDVIENHHAVVKREAQVGQLAIVLRRILQALDIAHRVVACAADGAPQKRQTGRAGAILLQCFFEQQADRGA